MKLARLLTIPEIAVMLGRSRRQALRKLRELHRRHGGTWLIRDGRVWRVNLSLMRRQIPAMFDHELVRDVDERVGACERELREQRLRLNGLGARMRNVERRIA